MAKRGAKRGGSGGATRESKVCPACGLPFENRKKWAARGLWDSIVYCSERCRRRGRPGGGGTDAYGADR